MFTVFVACLPVVFIGALQGTRTLDPHLKDMARAYRLPWRMRLLDLYLLHVIAYLFPAWITASTTLALVVANLGVSIVPCIYHRILPDGVGLRYLAGGDSASCIRMAMRAQEPDACVQSFVRYVDVWRRRAAVPVDGREKRGQGAVARERRSR